MSDLDRDRLGGQCHVEIEVAKGRKSLGLRHTPKAVRINGVPVPNVVSVDVQYHSGDVRRVVIVLIPTDVSEIAGDIESMLRDARKTEVTNAG